MGPDLDSDLLEGPLRSLRERLGEGAQDARAAFDQDDARLGRIDETEVASDGLPGDLRERARQLDARGAAADHDEGEQGPLLRAVLLALGRLIGQEHAAPDLQGILECLEAGREGLPLAVAEVGVTRPRGEDERVVAHVAAVQLEAPGGQVHLLDVGEEHRDVGRAAQDRPERGGDVGRVQRRGGDLVEERLEEVMVAPVE